MDVSVPPWLNVGPRDFGNAASEGARLDLARQQADTESAMNSVRLQIQKQQSDREFALQEQQHAVDQEVKRSQIQMAANAAARKYQAQQQYQSLVASGVEPAQAMLKVGPSLGINMVGAGQLAHWGTPPPPPQLLNIGGKKFAEYNRTLHPIREGPDWVDEDVNGHKFQRNNTTGELKPVLHAADVEGVLTPQQKARIAILTQQAKAISGGLDLGESPEAKAKLAAINAELDRLTGGSSSESAPDDEASPVSPATNTPPATSRFKIVAVK